MRQPENNKEKNIGEYILRKDIHSGSEKHYIILTNSQEKTIEVEVSKEVYNTLIDFSKWDGRVAKEYSRHIEHSELTEESLNKRALIKPDSIEDEVFQNIQNELLYKAISILPKTQQRRLWLYFFAGLTFEQIAEVEGCSHQAIVKSVQAALKKIQKSLTE